MIERELTRLKEEIAMLKGERSNLEIHVIDRDPPFIESIIYVLPLERFQQPPCQHVYGDTGHLEYARALKDWVVLHC